MAVDPILQGVVGTGLVGLHGRPFLPLDELLAEHAPGALTTSSLAALHEEVCLGYAQVPVDYTGGSHRTMGIMPPSRRDDVVIDYGEVLRGLDDAQWATFVSLADDPSTLAGVARTEIGEERSVPLSRRQMWWLKVRHGAYFPWKGYLELIPNRRWQDKADPTGKRFTRVAQMFFPRVIALVQRLPFVVVGRCNIMGLEAHDHGTVHRDGEPHEQMRPDEFITICPTDDKELFLWDEERRTSTPVQGARALWFNDFDYHGVSAAPRFRYSIRVDGIFTDAFRDAIARRFAVSSAPPRETAHAAAHATVHATVHATATTMQAGKHVATREAQ